MARFYPAGTHPSKLKRALYRNNRFKNWFLLLSLLGNVGLVLYYQYPQEVITLTNIIIGEMSQWLTKIKNHF